MPKWIRVSKRAGRLVAIAALVTSSAACQGGRWLKGPLIQAPPACVDFTSSIYFESESAQLTREADALISGAARRARRCAVTGIDVVGLADAPGDASANLELSKKRADAVTAALTRRDFKASAIKVAAAGDAGAQNPAGQAKPLRRRVDVLFHLAPLAR
jgi:outer membrane protein OmpA-like peptidoglycan-associated protein